MTCIWQYVCSREAGKWMSSCPERWGESLWQQMLENRSRWGSKESAEYKLEAESESERETELEEPDKY